MLARYCSLKVQHEAAVLLQRGQALTPDMGLFTPRMASVHNTEDSRSKRTTLPPSFVAALSQLVKLLRLKGSLRGARTQGGPEAFLIFRRGRVSKGFRQLDAMMLSHKRNGLVVIGGVAVFLCLLVAASSLLTDSANRSCGCR